MILNRLSARRTGTFYLAFLFILLIILLITVLVNAFRPHYSPPPAPSGPEYNDGGGEDPDEDDGFPSLPGLWVPGDPANFGRNLIQGTCAKPALNGKPSEIHQFWSQTGPGTATQQAYNASFGDGNASQIPLANNGGAVPIPAPGKTYYFYSGGANNASSGLRQPIHVKNIDFARIDNNTAPFTFRAWIGGSLGPANDSATITAQFENAAGVVLAATTLGPVAAAARGSVPELIYQQSTGTVPPHTRTIIITIHFTRFPGHTYNNGAIAEPGLYLGP